MIKFYNTLSREKQEFVPIDKKNKIVKMYSCGPTVYNTATIGNLRAYVIADILKKTINAYGYKIYDVMNLTDVGHLVSDGDDGEDKVEKAARAQGITASELAKRYTDQYFVDCEKLNIRRPQVVAPATGFIKQMVDMVEQLEKKGFAYTIKDGVYFDSSKVPTYNKLSRQPIESNIAGARIAMGEKRNPHDFALWKIVDPKSLQQWETKWGKHGAPAWHIECSAIAREFLGDTFDIHTGGIDHIPTHHTNEIAQTESLTGKPMANFWMHNEFMTVDGKKMSKSLGNGFMLSDIEKKGIDPIAFRYMCLLTHYRSIFNFTWEGLQSAQTALDNLVKQLARHKVAVKANSLSPAELGLRLKQSSASSEQASPATFSPMVVLWDDLNTPRAVALLWDAVKGAPSRVVYDMAIALDSVLSLDLETRVQKFLASQKSADVPKKVLDLAKARHEKKLAKDWAGADKLRDEVLTLGYIIKDTRDGYEVINK
ncbi:MAG: cysteine--tRNA ligase [Firmicutes bacterium]|nr:cysteine--tRNA ligase [Bacillota bacterium]